jgi:hypothetical protein
MSLICVSARMAFLLMSVSSFSSVAISDSASTAPGSLSLDREAIASMRT